MYLTWRWIRGGRGNRRIVKGWWRADKNVLWRRTGGIAILFITPNRWCDQKLWGGRELAAKNKSFPFNSYPNASTNPCILLPACLLRLSVSSTCTWEPWVGSPLHAWWIGKVRRLRGISWLSRRVWSYNSYNRWVGGKRCSRRKSGKLFDGLLWTMYRFKSRQSSS